MISECYKKGVPFLQIPSESPQDHIADGLPAKMLVPKSLILFIDAYDSFSSNIISLLETSLSCSVRILKIDDNRFSTDSLLYAELRNYAAVVCGPGPGHPENEKDVGLMKRIWRLCDEEMLPVIGICLGFQSLCLEFGGKVRRLRNPMHGIVRRVKHIEGNGGIEGEEDIFEKVGDIKATLYHSLCVDIGQDSIDFVHWRGQQKFRISANSPYLLPQAWVEAEEGWQDDERILMAVRHRTKPFWGLQYHPESICTDIESQKVIKNWFKHAQAWNQLARKHKINHQGTVRGEVATRASLLSQVLGSQILYGGQKASGHCSDVPWELRFQAEGLSASYRVQKINIPSGFSITNFMESNGLTNANSVLLESTNNAEVQAVGASDVRGRYSILGLEAQECTRIEYRAGDDNLTIYQRQLRFLPEEHRGEKIPLQSYGGVWQFMSHYVDQRRQNIEDHTNELPFWGGFMGYTTYELGLESIHVESGKRDQRRPDLCFVWVTRSIVVDHMKSIIYVQSLESKRCSGLDDCWLDNMAKNLRNSYKGHPKLAKPPTLLPTAVSSPIDSEYESKVRQCQQYIKAGDSYELCLTDQTTVTLPRARPTKHILESLQDVSTVEKFASFQRMQSRNSTPDTAWSLYKTLRKRQPAPFASYLSLGSATLVSSSPERFLTWDNRTGLCSLRPMKGTVKKSPTVTSLSQAKALLQVPKEQAENLMIVDLVRHDLHSVLGSGNVIVPRLMVVEEYASVFQMISIVEGNIPSSLPLPEDEMEEKEIEEAEKRRYTGIDVLAASLPPGSMTGAPKKRSCEILRQIEGHKDRSLYSGVVGYIDVGGRGDFSVSIRCMFRWDDEGMDEGKEVWHIGAGGAVTALSTPLAEREEMLTKLGGTLGVFGKLSGGESELSG